MRGQPQAGHILSRVYSGTKAGNSIYTTTTAEINWAIYLFQRQLRFYNCRNCHHSVARLTTSAARQATYGPHKPLLGGPSLRAKNGPPQMRRLESDHSEF